MAAEQQPGDPPPPPPPPPLLGRVSVLKGAFGFIASPSCAKDVFFHASACEGGLAFAQLAPGAAVAFELQRPDAAAPGRAAAARVRAAPAAPALVAVDEGAQRLGLIAKFAAAGGGRGSGWLRYFDPADGRLSHLTFGAQDLAPGVPGVERGQVVAFAVATDLRRQLAAAGARGAAHQGALAKHSYQRATQLRPLDAGALAVLPRAVQQQLAVLEAVAATFDPDADAPG
ncbi:hypothetical protein HT031_002057 [Scenedesmus sp. PABB004]|nr:hypothetical protein HT031_002057 [Scenedesmus sp. PABB004]